MSPSLSTQAATKRPRSAGPGRLLLVALALLLAAFVAGIWIVPGMLDWNRYRGSIAALVSAGVGRPVEITGNITLHLLPQPILTATGLRLNDAGDGAVMQAHEVRLRVALGPLLGGRVDARELVLRGADLRLPWPPPPGALSRRPPAWLTGLQARVEESRLQVGDFVADNVNASLGSDPETGTLSAAGAAKLFGLAWHFTTRLGKPSRDGAAPIDLSLDGQGKLRDTGGTFSGTLAEDGGLAGRIAARGPDLSQIMPAPALAWRGDGRLSASGGLAVADELAVEIGGSPARGAVALRVQPDLRLDLALTAGRLDLDGWVPVLLRAAQSSKASFPTGMDLSAEAASLNGGTLRALRLAFDVDQSGMAVRESSALLPGDARVTLQGRFPRNARGAMFEGTSQIVAPDLRATLRWLEPLAPTVLGSVPDAALRTADVSGKLAIDPAQFSFTDLKGTLDGSAAQGGFVLRLGPRPAISAGLTLDRLLLDPWLPDPGRLAEPAAGYTRLSHALATAGFDADIKVQARKATWRGTDFGPISIDGQTEGTRLTVRRLEVSDAGLHATASGTLGEGGRVSEGRIELTTQDVEPLRALVPADWLPNPAMLRGPASLLLQASGPPDALGIKTTVELNDLRLEAQPTLNLPARSWTGPVTVHHPGAPRLLEQLGKPGAAPWLGDGSFSIIAQVAAAPNKTELTHVELIAGAFRGAGQLTLTGTTLTGQVQAETLPLPMLYPRSPDPLPLDWLHGFSGKVHVEAAQVLVGLAPTVQDLTADLALADGVLAIDNAGAKLSGGTIGGAARIEAGEKPHMALDAHWQNIAVSGGLFASTFDLAAGTLSGQLALTGEGYSPAALAATLAGKGSVMIGDAQVTGLDLEAAKAALGGPVGNQVTAGLRDALARGTTRFQALLAPFEVHGGVVSLHAAGDAPPGSATLDGTLDLLGGILEGVLTLHLGPDLPDVAERLTGPAGAPARTPEFATVARWLAERS